MHAAPAAPCACCVFLTCTTAALPNTLGGAAAVSLTSWQIRLCLLPCPFYQHLPCLLPCPALSRRTIFNGNGKLPRELELAVDNGVLINVDSEFDLANIQVGAAWPGGGAAWGAGCACVRPPPLTDNST